MRVVTLPVHPQVRAPGTAIPGIGQSGRLPTRRPVTRKCLFTHHLSRMARKGTTLPLGGGTSTGPSNHRQETMRSYRISPISPIIGVLVNRERRTLFLRG
jgi:hypothetical protein